MYIGLTFKNLYCKNINVHQKYKFIEMLNDKW